LKLSVESWPKLSQEEQLFQQRRVKFSQHTKINKQQSQSKFSKVKDQWPRITIIWVNSILQESQLPQEECHKLKLPLKSTPTVSYKLALKIRELVNQRRLLSQMKREDYLKKKSIKCWEKLRNSLSLINKQRKESTLKIVWIVISILWKIQLKTQKN
jgi:hypothetical protein